tara:strand:+ start:77 stop:775 length:699 start_codon:yes stop_codon:yes gene_type:complete
MATSGVSTFNLDIGEICEEAFERAGLEMRTGYDLRTARRSLNLLCLEWQNRGINLWTVTKKEIPLVAGTSKYDIELDAIDLIEQFIRTDAGSSTSQSDIPITRISNSTYSGIPSKLTTGRPIQVWINRQRERPEINVWPVPDGTQAYTFVYYYLRRIQDVGDVASLDADVPVRFLPALVAGLALHIAIKRPESKERVVLLKEYYEEQFQLASEEDRVKATIQFVPYSYSYGQ